MSATDPFKSRVGALHRGLTRDRKEDEFVRNYVLDRSETYTLNPVERALCRTWVREEVSNVFTPMLGAMAIALVIRPRSTYVSRAIAFGGFCWPVYALSRGGISRPAIEFPGQNPLFAECVAACQKKFPHGQVVHRSKWIHDAQLSNNPLIEYPLNQAISPSNSLSNSQLLTEAHHLPNSQLAVKTPLPSDIAEPFKFWVKLYSSNMRRQLMSANSTSDRIALLRSMEKLGNDLWRTINTPQTSATLSSEIPDHDTVKSVHLNTAAAASLPDSVVDAEVEEEDLPVSQWPDLHPDVNIAALERLAESRRQAEHEKRACKQAREMMSDSMNRSELAQ